jgi:hypothetical protein
MSPNNQRPRGHFNLKFAPRRMTIWVKPTERPFATAHKKDAGIARIPASEFFGQPPQAAN